MQVQMWEWLNYQANQKWTKPEQAVVFVESMLKLQPLKRLENMVSGFIEEYRPALEALAKR